MDHKEHKLEFHQPLGLCNKFYSLVKFLPTHLLQLLISGQSTPRCVADAASGLNALRTEASSIAQENPPQEGEEIISKTSSDVPMITSINEKDASQLLEDSDIAARTQVQEEEAPPNKAPKKMVSINENVETIKISKKRNRKLKLQEADQKMPLKSILKVPFDAGNSQEPLGLLSCANGA